MRLPIPHQRREACHSASTFLILLLSSLPLSQSQTVAPTFAACGPANVDDFGTLVLTSSLLRVQADPSYNPSQISYQVTRSADGSIPATFTQDDVNQGAVTFVSNAPLATIGSSKPATITFIAADPTGQSVTCTMGVTINYNFAPTIEATSSLSITTTVGQPMLIDQGVLSMTEKHGLSTWNMNWTSVDTVFNRGGQGRIEYFTVANGWIPLPLTQPFPHQWVVNGALRYNPVRYIGRANFEIQLSNARGVTPTGSPVRTTIVITVNNSTVAVVATPNPPQANLDGGCSISYPTPFPISFATPYGPFCTSAITSPNVPRTLSTPFLNSQLSITTATPANVSFGTAVFPTSDFIPPGLTPLSFAGYLDYGAFSIYIDPPTTVITSMVYTSPELAYDTALTINKPSMITGIQFNDTNKQRSEFFVTSIETNQPRLRMTLFSGGLFALLAGSSQGNTGSNIQFGTVNFLGSWGNKSFVFPQSANGRLEMTISGTRDFTFALNLGGRTIWSPGSHVRVDYFTLSTTTTVAWNGTLTYVYDTVALMNLGVRADQLKWG
ncbi:hypothetical protein HDV05_007545 [Chytridiales sp. JEL 0842]|nr:hypothetical protein HDV05_007545 [Chytridiales sp. JEL 0842]